MSMIGLGKTIKGSAKGLAYMQDDKGCAVVIEKNLLISDNPKEQYWEMKRIGDGNLFTEKKVFTAVLSPEVTHTIDWTPDDWAKLSRDFAKAMHLDKSQYVSTLHTSTGQPHLHFTANRIGFDGKNMVTAHDIHKQVQRVADNLSKERGWRTAKTVSLEHGSALHPDKRKAQDELLKCLGRSKNFTELKEDMAERGYELTYNIRDGNVTGMRITHSATLKAELKRKKEQGIKPTYKEGSFKLSELKLNIKDLAYIMVRNNSRTQGRSM